MSKLIILRGNSGSGKTTVAKALQRKFGRNTLVVSHDVIRREMLWVKDGVNTPALPLLINLVKYGREHCEVVILEGILDSECYQELFQVAKQEFGEKIYAYYYDLPFEETVCRHQTKPNCNEFGASDMLRWWKEKDYIGIIPETRLTKECGFEEVVERIYREVAGNELMIKQATMEDVPAIEEILLDAVHWLASQGLENQWTETSIRWNQLSKSYKIEEFYVCYQAGKPAACMALTDEDHTYWPDIAKGDAIYLHKLAVKREFAGQGVSKKMIDLTKKLASERGATAVRLDCNWHRDKLRQVYERQGFELVEKKTVKENYDMALYRYKI